MEIPCFSGTVLVEPEEVQEDKNPVFKGPEFGAPKKTAEKAMGGRANRMLSLSSPKDRMLCNRAQQQRSEWQGSRCPARSLASSSGYSQGRFCSAIGCQNSSKKTPELSFFRFPKDKER